MWQEKKKPYREPKRQTKTKTNQTKKLENIKWGNLVFMIEQRKKNKCNGTIERMSIEVIIFQPSEPKVTIEYNIL